LGKAFRAGALARRQGAVVGGFGGDMKKCEGCGVELHEGRYCWHCEAKAVERHQQAHAEARAEQEARAKA